MASLESKTEYNELVLWFLTKTEDNDYKLHWYHWDDRSDMPEFRNGLYFAENAYEDEGDEIDPDNIEYFYDEKDGIEKAKFTDNNGFATIFRANCRLYGRIPMFYGGFGHKGKPYIEILEAI